MVCPGPKLRLEATGLAVPVGKTVRYDPAVGSVAVMLTTTADTPVLGTPPWPAAWTSQVAPGPSGLIVRVSMMRAGGSGVNVPCMTGGAHDDGWSSGVDASTRSGLWIWPGTGPPAWPHQSERATTVPPVWESSPASRSGRVMVYPS